MADLRPHSVDSALLGRDYATAILDAAHEVRDADPESMAPMADLARGLILTQDAEAAFACIMTLAATAVLHCDALAGGQ